MAQAEFKPVWAMAGGLAAGVAALGSLLMEIRKAHRDSGAVPLSLAQMFHTELVKTNDRIGGAIRIVVVLDPLEKSPTDAFPFLRSIMALGLPSKVRFVIAQRPNDKVLEAVKNNTLEGLHPQIIKLKELQAEEQSAFIDEYDEKNKLIEQTSDVFLQRYGGWPQLMKLALEELQQIPDDIDAPGHSKSSPGYRRILGKTVYGNSERNIPHLAPYGLPAPP
jgi:hypothetical protein